jgi:hypothetical protein
VWVLHRARGDEEHMFLGWATKPRSMVCQWFGFKTTGTIYQWFVLKTTGTVSWFGLKTADDGFSRFGLKTGGFGLLGLGLKIGRCGLVIWASKSPRQFLSFDFKTKQATVCRLRHKTDGMVTT